MTSDPFIRAAVWAGVVSLAITVMLAVAIVVMRWRQARATRHWQRFADRWRPVLLEATLVEPGQLDLPVLDRSDRLRFLRLWMYVHQTVRGAGRERLADLARSLGLDDTARRRLASLSRVGRLQAVLASGLLRDAAAWDRLLSLSRDRDPLLSVCAARALVRIDPARALPHLLPAVSRRFDWDPAMVVSLVAEARAPWEAALCEALPRVPSHERPRALRLAAALRIDIPSELQP